jgi:hypothetical protein
MPLSAIPFPARRLVAIIPAERFDTPPGYVYNYQVGNGDGSLENEFKLFRMRARRGFYFVSVMKSNRRKGKRQK